MNISSCMSTFRLNVVDEELHEINWCELEMWPVVVGFFKRTAPEGTELKA